MPVRFFYVDESHDDNKFCLSAISIRHSDWKECFDEVRAHRVRLSTDHGMFLRKEIHAHEFVAGRGQPSRRPLGKWQRSRIFLGMLQLVARLPIMQVFNICLDRRGLPDPQMTAWDRLLNRIERTMLEMENQEIPLRTKLTAQIREKLPTPLVDQIERRLMLYRSRAFVIADEGRELEITRALRRMHVHNPIPSKYGTWPSGSPTQNITTDRLIEDPTFKASSRSYFIQLADCVAFALLKREVAPTPHVNRYGIHEMFDQALSGVCFKKASPRDPLGIVRR
jgi:Protein of unknown function (DUF3800)